MGLDGRLMRPVAHADLEELLRYALLKVPPLTRAALAAPEAHRRRSAEALIANRIIRDMRHLEVSAPPGHELCRSDPRRGALPLGPEGVTA